jgi:hypothetical protein
VAKRNTSEAINTKEGEMEFRAAAASYTKRATRSKAAAREALKSVGIITKSGKLTAKYK